MLSKVFERDWDERYKELTSLWEKKLSPKDKEETLELSKDLFENLETIIDVCAKHGITPQETLEWFCLEAKNIIEEPKFKETV